MEPVGDRAPGGQPFEPAGAEQSLEERLAAMEERLRRLERTASRWKNWSTREQCVNELMAARRARDALFEGDLFGEPGWDMLLSLYAAGLRDRRIASPQIEEECDLAQTTVLRWLGRLEEEGMIYREPDPEHGRRIFIVLTDRAFDLMSKHVDLLIEGGGWGREGITE